MSQRNTRKNKKIRKLRKALRRPLPAYLDLFVWLKLRGFADTTGKCRRLILDGRVKSESHTLGIVKAVDEKGNKFNAVEQFQPYSVKETLRVEAT